MSWDDIEEHLPKQLPKQQYGGGQGGFQKKPWNGGSGFTGGGFQKGPLRKVWQEKDIDISNTVLYRPVAVAFNKEAAIDDAIITPIINRLNDMKLTVRTGGDGGLSDRFEQEVQRVEMHLPWKMFNDRESKFTFNPEEAYYVAKLYMPNYESMKDGVKPILARNARLIMGKNMLSPALFLITWSPDGIEHARDRSMKTGNVGHVIAIATALRIPIFNLANRDALTRIMAYLDE